MKKLKLAFFFISAMLLAQPIWACVGHDDHDLDDHSRSVGLCPQEVILTSSSLQGEAPNHLAFQQNWLTTARDKTSLRAPMGLFGFFKKALTKIAIWAGMRLTNWVVNKINQRSNTYAYYYNSDRGVQKAAMHWDDLLYRSNCYGGREPDHMPDVRGYQSWRKCPMCTKQVNDFR